MLMHIFVIREIKLGDVLDQVNFCLSRRLRDLATVEGDIPVEVCLSQQRGKKGQQPC